MVRVEQESWTGRAVGLVTNRVDGTAAKSMARSWQRGPPETVAQDGQGPLGFDAERRRRSEALGQHGCRVVVASSLWHRPGLPAVPDRTQGRRQTLGEAGRQQGRARIPTRWLCVQDQWSHGAPADPVLAQLCAKQPGMVPV